MGENGTWLCPGELDRARLLENSRRVSRARTIASATIALCLVYVAPTDGWWVVGLFALSALNTQTLERRMRGSARPEYHVACSILLSQALIATAAGFTGGPQSAILPLVAVPTAFAATRFRLPVSMAASLAAIAMLLAATFGLHPTETFRHPLGLITAVAVVIGISAAAQALNGAELHYRDTAVLDPLTGLLNRQGLERRFEELAEQARVTGAPVSVLVCDLDNFKVINDSHGHAIGDAVLRDVAYQLRKELRSFELIYRIGGEEFLVLLPSVTLETAQSLGERLRDAARQTDSHGVTTTLSIGASTLWGDEVQFDLLFDAADRALYQAKANGRDRVVCSPDRTPVRHPKRSKQFDDARPRWRALPAPGSSPHRDAR